MWYQITEYFKVLWFFYCDFTLFRFLCHRRSLTHNSWLVAMFISLLSHSFIRKRRPKFMWHIAITYIYFIFRISILIIIILCMRFCVHEPSFVFNCARRRFLTVNQKTSLKWNVVHWTVFNLFVWMPNGSRIQMVGNCFSFSNNLECLWQTLKMNLCQSLKWFVSRFSFQHRHC